MMKKTYIYFYLFTFLVFFAGVPGININAQEIILPGAPSYLFEGAEVLLELKGSNSPSFKWDFDDGSVETGGRRITHVFRGRGIFNVKVSDLQGKIDPPITKRLTIVRDDREIVINGQLFLANMPVKIEARNFIDRSVRWDFGDGKDQKLGQTVTHIYQRGGTYIIKAVDFAGRDTKKITKEIKITEDNRSVEVPKEIIVGEMAKLQLKNSPGSNYTWEFSDGQRGSGTSLDSITFKRPGVVTLIIKDNSGGYPELVQRFEVKPDLRQLKSLHAFALPEESVCFAAEHFKGNSVNWDFGDGTVKNNGSKKECHQFKKSGTYKITARDFNGQSQKFFSTNISVKDLSPDFQLVFLEIAFDNGKYYQVAPLKNLPPSYYVKMKTIGRGILRGKWMLDGQPLGLFDVLLRQNEIVDLIGNRVPSLPMKDLGIHNLTIEFINYQFSQSIPVIRYFVTETDAIRIVSPENGDKVTLSVDKPLELQWKFDDPYTVKKYEPTYQIFLSEVPLQFLTDDKLKWEEAGQGNRYSPDVSGLKGKDKNGIWVYWQIRALKSNGDVLTISEISSFKLKSK